MTVMYHHLESARTESGEVLPDHMPGRHRLRVGVLPTGPGERRLHLGREEVGRHQQGKLAEQHRSEVSGRPGSEPGEESGPRAWRSLARPRIQQRGGHGSFLARGLARALKEAPAIEPSLRRLAPSGQLPRSPEETR
jgi:hypothetical protein